MSTTVNPDATKELPILTRSPRPGSCWSDAQIQELQQLLFVFAPEVDPADASPVPISKNVQNLAQLDADNAVFVQADLTYEDTQVWIEGTTTELFFSGWNSSIDPTSKYCTVFIIPIYSTGEAGTLVRNSAGSGTTAIRPTWEVSSFSANRIGIKVYQNSADVAITVRLIQHPIPPEQA